MFLQLTVILCAIAVFSATASADSVFSDKDGETLFSIIASKPCNSDVCIYNLPFPDRQIEVTPIKLNDDIHKDYLVIDRENCGSTCIEVVFINTGSTLESVFEGQNIGFSRFKTNGIYDIVLGYRGRDLQPYTGRNRYPIYRWNGRAYVEQGVASFR